MGLLAAVRQWYRRDHAAEQRMWLNWMQGIEKRLKPLPSTNFEYLEPEDLSNKATQLRVKWDANVLKITGPELAARLDAGSPRILINAGGGRRPDQMASSVTIMPYMLDPGEAHIIAEAMHAALTNPGPYPGPVAPSGASAAIDGSWAVTVRYLRGEGAQKFTIRQEGADVTGRHDGEHYNGRLRGRVQGDQVELHTVMEVPGNPIHWTFTGSVQAGGMSGKADMGEYGPVTWTAVRA